MARIALAETDSTNAEGFRRGAGPAWITSGVQTAGRGRRARPWVSPPGNLYATFVMHPAEPPPVVALRSFVAALALRDALVATTRLPDAFRLKWPNDVLLDGGKVAGILLESAALGGPKAVLCIGIGVNLATAPAPEMVEPGALQPVSLLAKTGLVVAPEVLLSHLALAFDRRDRDFTLNGFPSTRAAWLSHAARLGEMIRARMGTTDHEGIFDTIDEAGRLMMRTGAGAVAIPAADVFF